MNFILVSGVLLTAVVSVVFTGSLKDKNKIPDAILYDESVQITKNSKSLFNDLGVIPNLRQCGGSGKLIRWRHEPCTPYALPCVIPAGRRFRGAIVFIPSESSESMGARTDVHDVKLGTEIVSWQDSHISDSEVEAGKEYVFTAGVTASPDIWGKLVRVQISIYRESDKKVETCAEAEYLIV